MTKRVAELTADQTPEGEISYNKVRSQVETVEREAAKQGRKAKREITATHIITGLRGFFRAVAGRPLIEKRRHVNINDLEKSYNKVIDANVSVKAEGSEDEIGCVGVHDQKSRLRSVVNVKDEESGFTILASIVKEIGGAIKRALARRRTRSEEQVPEPSREFEEKAELPASSSQANAPDTEEGLQRDFNSPASEVPVVVPPVSAPVVDEVKIVRAARVVPADENEAPAPGAPSADAVPVPGPGPAPSRPHSRAA